MQTGKITFQRLQYSSGNGGISQGGLHWKKLSQPALSSFMPVAFGECPAHLPGGIIRAGLENKVL